MAGTDNTVTISRKEYEELKKRDLKLTALEHSGVDNWDWYGDAMDQYQTWLAEIAKEVDET